jgi:hypothetical protein
MRPGVQEVSAMFKRTVARVGASVLAIATTGLLAVGTAAPAGAVGSQCTPSIFNVTNTTASPQVFTIIIATPSGLTWEAGDEITISSTAGPSTASIEVNDVVVASSSLDSPLVYTFPGDLVAPPLVSTRYDFTLPAGATATGSCVHPVASWPTAPTGPFNVTATPGPASKQITLGWSPANANGSAIVNYTGTCVAAAANPGLPTKTATTGPGKTSLLMGGLVAGKKYSCTVRATNGVGDGPNVTTTPLVVTSKP